MLYGCDPLAVVCGIIVEPLTDVRMQLALLCAFHTWQAQAQKAYINAFPIL